MLRLNCGRNKIQVNTIKGTTWFLQTLADAFMPSLQIVFYIGAVLSALAAILSVLRGDKFIHESHEAEFESGGTLISEKTVSKEEGK